MEQNDPSEKTAAFKAAKKLSRCPTTDPRCLRTSSGCSRTASEKEQKITPTSASAALKVVTTETESMMASTATPERRSCSASELPRLSNVARISGSTSSRLAGPGPFVSGAAQECTSW